MKKISLLIIILINTLFFLYNVSNLSISYQEASIIFDDKKSLFSLFLNFLIQFFDKNETLLRGIIFIFHLSNIFLIYKISKLFLKRESDRVITIAIYSIIPGVISFSIILSPVTIVIFFTLLYLYLYLNRNLYLSFLILILSLFIDNSFYILYFTLIIFAIISKDRKLLLLSSTLFIISISYFGFPTGGKPKGYFLDTFAIYLAVFSPLLFLYFFYVLYRDMVLKRFNIIWSISFFTMILSFLLSLRQKLFLEDFVPFIVISIPLLVKSFFSSYRVRLPEYRRYYKLLSTILLTTLIVNFLILFFNQYLFLFLINKKSHFAYSFYFAKELADKLKENGIYNIKCDNKKLQKRLLFYGIKEGDKFFLSDKKINNYFKKVTLSNIKEIKKVYYVSKINKK